ncbi:MAG: DUF3891 family protein [Acidobacteria bacterium]|nr:MAG: DUF3891 family protein [Acidobacteriota bacterium]
MIVARHHGRLRVVTQSDHAHLAGAILALWRDDGLPEHPRRQALIFAAREHDNGWREADAAPRIDPESGRPCDFAHLPDDVRREIWERGVTRHAQTQPYPALLIVEHALNLHRSHRDDPAWQEVLSAWRELRATLLEETGAAPATVREDYRFIDLSDLISLVAAGGWRRAFRRHGRRGKVVVERRGDGAVLGLDPFPLAGSTTFHLPCRWIDDRPYAGDGDLALALARARWQELAVRLAPLDAAGA